MSEKSSNPKEHIEVGRAVHETVQEEYTRRDTSYSIPIGDLFTVMSALTPKEELAKAVFEQEKAAGKTDAEALQTSTESKKIAEVAEKADEKVAVKQKQATVKLRQAVAEKSPELAMQTFSMNDAEFWMYMSEYSQMHRDSISSEFFLQDAILERQRQQVYANAQRQFEAMPLSEKAKHYALVAKDATLEYANEFRADPLGHSRDLALGTAYFAGDLITPGGLDAPARFVKGETSFGQMLGDQSVSASIEGATGLVVGKVLKVGKRVGSALVRGEKALQKAVVQKIAEREVGKVGTYGKLTKGVPKGGFADGLHAHHSPSQSFIKKYGVHSDDWLSVLMTKEQHALTRTYKSKARHTPVNATVRSELAADLRDIRTILRKDGMYTPQVNQDLMRVSTEFRQQFPDLFKK